MKPLFTHGFVREYQRLPQHLQRRFDKALEFLLLNLRHRSLRAKKMGGERDTEGRDVWEARVTKNYRFTFAIEDDVCILYRIGPHDIERHPL